jgi:hypothetical protein
MGARLGLRSNGVKPKVKGAHNTLVSDPSSTRKEVYLGRQCFEWGLQAKQKENPGSSRFRVENSKQVSSGFTSERK